MLLIVYPKKDAVTEFEFSYYLERIIESGGSEGTESQVSIKKKENIET